MHPARYEFLGFVLCIHGKVTDIPLHWLKWDNEFPRVTWLLRQPRKKGSPISSHLNAFRRSQAETLSELERKPSFSVLHSPILFKLFQGGIPGCSCNVLNGWPDTEIKKSSYCFRARWAFSNPRTTRNDALQGSLSQLRICRPGIGAIVWSHLKSPSPPSCQMQNSWIICYSKSSHNNSQTP